MSARAALPPALAEHAVCSGRALALWRTASNCKSQRIVSAEYGLVQLLPAGCALADTPVIDLSLLLSPLSLDLFEFEFSFVSQVVIMFMVPCLSASRAEMGGNRRFISQIPKQRSK